MNKKKVLFDPFNFFSRNSKESNDSSQDNEIIQITKFDVPKLVLSEVNNDLQTSRSSKSKDLKINIIPVRLQKKVEIPKTKNVPQIIKTEIEDGKKKAVKNQMKEKINNEKQVELMQQLLRENELRKLKDRKIKQIEGECQDLRMEVKEEQIKNKELNLKILDLLQHTQNTQRIYQLQNQNQIISNRISILQVQNAQLQSHIQQLVPKQLLLQKLQIQFQSLKMKCQDYQQNCQKYKGQIASTKKSIRQFQDQFYSLGKKPKNKQQQAQFFMSLTQKKLQLIEQKVNQFQDSLHNQQLSTYQKQKSDLIVKFGKQLQRQIDRILKLSDIVEQRKKQDLIQKVKRDNEVNMSYQISHIQNRIDEYKLKIHEKKLLRQKKTVRQRVRDIESKITQLSHSQFLSFKNNDLTESDQVGQLKKKLNQQDNQLQYLKKLSTNSYMSQHDKQKYTIKVITQTDSNVSPRNSINLSAAQNLRNTYLNKLLGNSLTARQEYQDGTPVPNLAQYKELRFQLNNFKRKNDSYDQQITHIRVAYEKLSQTNSKLYQQAQDWKKKYNEINTALQKIRISYKSQYAQIQKYSTMKITYLTQQFEILNKHNSKLQKLIDTYEGQKIEMKKGINKLNNQIEKFKNQIIFLQAKFQVQECDKNVRFTEKITAKLEYHVKLQNEIQMKNQVLQKQLQQLLNFQRQLQEKQETISELRRAIYEQSLKISGKDGQIEELNNEIYNLAYKLEQLERQIKKADQKINRKEQNWVVKMEEKKKQLALVKKQNKKVNLKLQALQQKYQNDMKKKDKKYRKLEDKYIGMQQNYSQLQKKSLSISKSMSLKGSLSIQQAKGQIDEDSCFISDSLNKDSSQYSLSFR